MSPPLSLPASSLSPQAQHRLRQLSFQRQWGCECTWVGGLLPVPTILWSTFGWVQGHRVGHAQPEAPSTNSASAVFTVFTGTPCPLVPLSTSADTSPPPARWKPPSLQRKPPTHSQTLPAASSLILSRAFVWLNVMKFSKCLLYSEKEVIQQLLRSPFPSPVCVYLCLCVCGACT